MELEEDQILVAAYYPEKAAQWHNMCKVIKEFREEERLA